MKIEERKKQINGHSIFYRTAGESKEAIVLMHGIPTNSYLWIELLPLLAVDYTVIAPDLLGFGQSGRVNPAQADLLSLPNQAKYILSLLDQEGIEKAHFIGHDLGGGVAQILAVHHPDRVASFVVIDGVCFNNWPLREVVAMRNPTAPEFEPSPLLIERMLRVGTYHQSLVKPDLIAHLAEPFNHPAGAKELQTASLALNHHHTEDLIPHLSNIQVKASFLWGDHDPYLPAYWGEKLQQAVPDSTFMLIPQAGHFSMIDNPVMVLQGLLDHLNQAK